LEEYIEFIGGVREGINDDVAYQSGGVIPSARYYTRIRKLRAATAETAKSVKKEQMGQGTTNEPLPDDFPQMYQAWDELIMAYRQRAYSVYKIQR
jgi:hypothetical protein